jgi:hypothetical protein
MKRNANLYVRATLALLISMPVVAEELPMAPVPRVIPPPNSGGFFSDPTTIQNNLPTGQVSGREYKANDATNQASSGNGAAIAAGVALTAAAAAAFAALQFARGTTLATMASLEFAQAGADRTVAGQNWAQETLLRQEAGQTSNQNTNPGQISGQIDPSVPGVLRNMGVADPDAFLNDLVSGNLTTPQAVLDAIGQSGNFTETEVEAMGDFSKVNMAEILGQAEEGDAAASVLGFNEASNTVAAASASGRSQSADGQSDSGLGADGEVELSNGGKGHGQGREPASLGSSSGDASGAFQNHGSGDRAGKSIASSIEGFDRANLKELGILKPHGKRNIFQIAERNYRSFHGWRKSRRLVTPQANQQVAKTGALDIRKLGLRKN